MFADDMALIADSEDNLQYNFITILEEELKKVNIKVNKKNYNYKDKYNTLNKDGRKIN